MKEFIEKLKSKLEEAKSKYQELADSSNFDGWAQEEKIYLAKEEVYDNTIQIVNQLAEEYKGGWIPFTQREITEEEKEEMGTDFDYILDCKLPENDTEILICSVNGLVFTDTFFNDGDGCYLDSGYDFIEDAIAWQPLPPAFEGGSE